MANEQKWTYANVVALEESGATISNAAFASAPDASMTSGNHDYYPLCDLTLYVSGFASALAGWQVLNIYRRDMDLAAGANDAPAPSATYPQKLVAQVPLPQSNATNTTGYYSITEVPLSESCYFYIENPTGQNLNQGWGLWCRPKTFLPGA